MYNFDELSLENSITENWCDLMVQVSIVCISYNHAPYISQTLESILAQKTNFAFEIIIHDDASTDGTIDIVREYQRKFPRIIKLIVQTENQLSQKNFNLLTHVVSIADGKFIAVCNGDDYWSETYKIQMQFDALNLSQYKNINLCFHAASMLNMQNKETQQIPYELANKKDDFFVISQADILSAAKAFAPASSMFIRKEFVLNLPDLNHSPSTDYYFQILATDTNGALYLNNIMMVYRLFTPNSWSEKTLFLKDDIVNHTINMVTFIKELDKILPKQKKAIEQALANCLASLWIFKGYSWTKKFAKQQNLCLKIQFLAALAIKTKRNSLNKIYSDYLS